MMEQRDEILYLLLECRSRLTASRIGIGLPGCISMLGTLWLRPRLTIMDRFQSALPYSGRVVMPALLQFGVLGFGLLQDGDVGVGVFPEGEEIFVGIEGAGTSSIGISALRSFRLQGIRTRHSQTS